MSSVTFIFYCTNSAKKRFGLVTHNFEPNLTGDAVVQFRVISGKWNIADISLRPS